MNAILIIAAFVYSAGVCLAQYQIGPRGGCYTMSSRGKKQYVDHSLCGTKPAVAAVKPPDKPTPAVKPVVVPERDKKAIPATMEAMPVGTVPSVDIATKLEALAKLFTSGLLTAEEFQQAKKKLLEQK